MDSTLGLVHTIYLDVPMMVSFVAALEGGYALENVLKISKEDTGAAAGEATAEVGIPSLLGNLVKANLKGSGKVEGEGSTIGRNSNRAQAHRSFAVHAAQA